MVSSKMYLAKLSMNSDIYDFYENRNLFDNYLNKVYASINNITKIYDEYNNIYKFNTLLFFLRPHFLAGVLGSGFSSYVVLMMESYSISNLWRW